MIIKPLSPKGGTVRLNCIICRFEFNPQAQPLIKISFY